MTTPRDEPLLKRLVRQRAGDRCEYCLIAQADDLLTQQLEHVMARQHGGDDAAETLALACEPCNGLKGPNLCATDPDTGLVARVFHPRRQDWAEHFRLSGGVVAGRTAVGRATSTLLHMNRRGRVLLRRLRYGADGV